TLLSASFAPAGRSASSAEIGYAAEPSVGQIRGILRPPNLPRRISKLCKEIDERVHAFLDRPLAGKWPHLWLDAKSRRSSMGPRPRKSGSHQTPRWRRQSRANPSLAPNSLLHG